MHQLSSLWKLAKLVNVYNYSMGYTSLLEEKHNYIFCQELNSNETQVTSLNYEFWIRELHNQDEKVSFTVWRQNNTEVNVLIKEKPYLICFLSLETESNLSTKPFCICNDIYIII